jgi:hypothetical protein
MMRKKKFGDSAYLQSKEPEVNKIKQDKETGGGCPQNI